MSGLASSSYSSRLTTSAIITRKSQRHFIFGDPAKLPTNVLPTIGQVVRYFVYLKDKPKSGNQAVVQNIADNVMKIWQVASIPTVQRRTVINRINKIITTGSELSRSKTSKLKITKFINSFSQLLDICSCTCQLTVNTDLSDATCICPKTNKVPQRELKFLHDQRTSRKMYIGGVDKVTTKKLKNLQARKNAEELRNKAEEIGKVTVEEHFEGGEQEMQEMSAEISTEEEDEEEEEYADDDNESDSDTCSNAKTSQLRVSLSNLVREADRFGVSDRAAAALATAVLQDFGLVSESDQSKVIDKSKIRRERHKLRENLKDMRSGRAKEQQFTALYFDGKKDDTLMKRKEGGKCYTTTEKEEHYVLVSEPDSQYIAHVSPQSSKSKDVADSIMTKIKDLGVESELRVIGCDSANINTGFRGGVVQYIENELGRPLQWCICLLHTNELPLRHLFLTMDGATTGANTFSGRIGKAIQFCEKMPAVNFKAIVEGEGLPEISTEVLSDLSTDQLYLYKIVQSIREGHIPEDLARQKPGRLNHSRWLTLANRICRLYIASVSPDKKLHSLTHFIVTFYSVMWFSIRYKPSCIDGPKHLFLATVLFTIQLPDVKDIIKPYISRNAYFAHPENILLALMSDDSKAKRRKAVQIILNNRISANNAALPIRQFKVPDINFNAADWDELIDFNKITITEPPLTADLTNPEINNIIDQPLHLPLYPNHTQHVERHIREVTEASSKVYGADARHGFIVARLTSRSRMPQFDTKKEFKCSSVV
jgi:hypothetical protein